MVFDVEPCVKKAGVSVRGAIFHRESLYDVVFGFDESGVEGLAEDGNVARAGGGFRYGVDARSVGG